jgi:biotin carboxylase
MDVEGIKTTLPLLRRILEHPGYQQGDVSTGFLQELLDAEGKASPRA